MRVVTSGVAVVVPTRDRPRELDGALRALAGALREHDRVLVVDSASRSGAVAAVAERHGAALLRVSAPGASRARNAGWRAADAPVVAFTDDDCRPRPGWAAALEDALADGDHAFAYGRVEPSEDVGVPVSVLVDPAPAGVDLATPLGHLGHGANMAFRRAVLEAIGGFDEVLGAGAPLRASEDKDAFWRALRAGGSGRYVPAAAVAHLPRPTRRAAVVTAYAYGVGEGAFAAKRARLGIADARSAWSEPLRQAGEDARARYWTGVAAGLARTAGWSAGYRQGRTWPLRDGRFVPA